jgi:hypothetical protein
MRALQAVFLDDLTGLAVREVPDRADDFVLPSSSTVEARWHVYTHGYRARLAEALSEDFRAIHRILGEEVFESLLERYLSQCAPRSYDLGHAGDRLAGFLMSDRLTAELPFLTDLARLEWAMVEAFVAEDAEPLDPRELERLGPEAAAALRFTLQPAASIVRSSWPLDELWATRDQPDDAIDVELEGRPVTVAVLRRGWSVRCEALDEEEAQLAETARASVSLSEYIQLVGAETDERRVEQVLVAFGGLVSRGLLIRDRNSGKPDVS